MAGFAVEQQPRAVGPELARIHTNDCPNAGITRPISTQDARDALLGAKGRPAATVAGPNRAPGIDSDTWTRRPVVSIPRGPSVRRAHAGLLPRAGRSMLPLPGADLPVRTRRPARVPRLPGERGTGRRGRTRFGYARAPVSGSSPREARTFTH
ncbi:DUF6233 domain-containing protein [Streptomyces sp. NPDC059340]|uniref:DUF6233 domain-containing protein n=1 Tax=Streptomyces sp. NPDC059340 TaxID=3346806 RepID=UPI0036764E70